MSVYGRLKAASIWDENAIPLLDLKYAAMKRVLFPSVDLVFMYIGITGSLLGLPSIDDTYGSAVARIGGGVFAVLGAAALLGVSFPRFSAVETIAKSLLAGFLVIFIGALLAVSNAVGNANRLYLIGFAAIAILIILFRLSILRHERTARLAAARGDREDLGL